MDTPAPPSLRRDAIALGLLSLATLLLFLPSLPYAFLNWDDQMYIHKNAWLLNLSWENAAGVFRFPYFSNYHPLTMLSYMVDFSWFGYEPEGYRAVNIALHAATVAAAFALFRALGAGTGSTFLALLFFAIHPLRIESVVWISERKDVLCGLFYTLSLLCWVRAGKSPARGAAWLSGAILCAVLAMLAKAMAISLPAVILLHDCLYDRERLKDRAPLYLLIAAMAAVIAWVNKQAQVEALIVGIPFVEKLKVAAWAPLHYVAKSLWPSGLCALYPYEFRPTVAAPAAAAGVLFTTGLVAGAAWSWKRAPGIAFGLLAAGLALGPVSGIVAFSSAYAADRYSYLPTLVLLAGVTVYTSRAVEGLGTGARRSIAALVLAACAALGVTTARLLPNWQDSAAVWSRVLAIYPESGKARLNLAHAQLVGGESVTVPEAPEREETAGAIDSMSQAGQIVVWKLIKEGRSDDALKAAQSIQDPAISLFWQLRVHQRTNDRGRLRIAADALLALGSGITSEQRAEAGLSLVMAGEDQAARAALDGIPEPTFKGALAWGLLAQRAAEAADSDAMESAARRALAIFPAEGNAIPVLAPYLLGQQRLTDATGVLKRAARHPAALQATRSFALSKLGMIAAGEGDTSRAEDLYAQAFEVTLPETLGNAERAREFNYLGWLAEEAGQPVHAERLYTQALTAQPGDPDVLQNLAYIRIQQGRESEAIGLLEQALTARPDDATIRQNLERLRAASESTPASLSRP